MQQINMNGPEDGDEQQIPDTEREEDLKNLIGVLMGNVQVILARTNLWFNTLIA
jgi:hypothetical protein